MEYDEQVLEKWFQSLPKMKHDEREHYGHIDFTAVSNLSTGISVIKGYMIKGNGIFALSTDFWRILGKTYVEKYDLNTNTIKIDGEYFDAIGFDEHKKCVFVKWIENHTAI